MNSAEKKNLLVFGYGLSLLIPFFILLHPLKASLSSGLFALALIAGFALIMFVISKMSSWEPAYNLWVLPIQFGLILHRMRNGDGGLPVVFLLVSILFLFVTIFCAEQWKPFYGKWMAVTRWIGLIFSTIVFSLVFFLVFGLIGLILRLLRKDILSLKIEPDKESYWITRERAEFKRERYTQQF